MEFDVPEVNSQVSVFWADLNVSFEGVVEAVNSDGTYNIRYDALVNGNISKELNVSRDRVTVTFHLEDSYFGDDVVEVSNHMASSRNVVDFLAMSDEELRKLCNSLSLHKLMDMWNHAEDDIQIIMNCITERLVNASEDIVEISGHLKPEEGCDEAAQQAVIYIDCASAMFRIYAFLCEVSKKNAQKMPSPVKEEYFDKVVFLVHEFFHKTLGNATVKDTSGSPSKSKKREKDTAASGDISVRKIFSTALYILVPSMVHFLEMIRLFSYHCSPTGRIAYVLMETSLAILGMDQTQNPLVGLAITKKFSDILRLCNAATLLLRTFYRRFDYRDNCVQSLVGLFHSVATSKPVWRPIAVQGNDKDRLTTVTHAVLVCVQGLVSDVNGLVPVEKDVLGACYKAMNEIASELLQRCLNKDMSDDYFATATFVVQEMLVAIQTPALQASLIFLQLLSLSICLELNNRTDNVPGEGKRDLGTINQLLELLGTIADGLAKFGIDWRRSRSVAFEADLALHVKQRLAASWSREKPLWMNLMAEKEKSDGDYWTSTAGSLLDDEYDEDEDPVTSADQLSFIKALDAIHDINTDVINIVFEAQSIMDREKVENHLLDGCVSLTIALLPELTQAYDLRRLLSEVQECDLQFLKIIRSFADKFGLEAFSAGENCFDFGDESQRDMCIMTFGLWIKTLQQDRVTAADAVRQVLRSLLQKQVVDPRRPNLIKKNTLPMFLTDIKPEVISTVCEVNMTLARANSRGLVYKLIEQFVGLLSDSTPTVRSRALKMLSRITAIDNTILSFKKVKEAIEFVLSDRSISVREEGVKLISGYVISGESEEAHHYLLTLLPLMADDGISVRKSVMNILRDTLLKFPFHAHYREICSALLGRLSYAKEEESIKELICAIFQTIWFLPPSPQVCTALSNLYASSTTSSVLDKSAAEKVRFIENFLSSRERQSQKRIDLQMLHVRFTALQLVEMLIFQQEVRPWILSLLQSLLHGKAAGNEASTTLKQKRQSSFDHCDKIIKFQIELLLRIEEQDTSILEYLDALQFDVDDYKVNTVASLALFSNAHPPFVTDLTGFLPYLKGADSSKHKMEICGHVVRIIQSTATLQKHALRAHCEEIQRDLANIALKQSSDNVNTAVECMVTLCANVSQDAAIVFQLGKTCFDPLIGIARKIYETEAIEPAQVNMLRRCLVVLGFVCEHSRKCSAQLSKLAGGRDPRKHDAFEEQAARTPLKDCQPFHPYTMYGSCFAAVLFAVELGEETILVSAVKTLCGIFAGFPKMMEVARQIDLLERLFDPSMPFSVTKSFLTGLKSMMAIEEARVERQASLQQMSDAGVSISSRENVLGAGNSSTADSTLGGFILQQHLHHLKQFMRHESVDIRQAVLQLVGTLLRQGMLPPAEVLGDLIMLQSDAEEDIRAESLHIVLVEDERHPTYVESKFLEGLELTFAFQVARYGCASSFISNGGNKRTPIWSPLYTQVIQADKRKKIRFLARVLERCANTKLLIGNNHSDGKKSASLGAPQLCQHLKEMTYRLSRIEYFAATLAALPFMSAEEPLYIISYIGRHVPVEVASSLSALLPLLRAVGVTLISLLDSNPRLRARAQAGDDNDAESNSTEPSITTLSSGKKESKSSNSSKSSNNAAAWEYIEASVEEDTFLLTTSQILSSGEPQLAGASNVKARVNNSNGSAFWKRWAVVLEAMITLRALEVLLRLKAYLKQCYNISDERCLAYRPDDAQVTYEKFVNQSLFESNSEFRPSPLLPEQDALKIAGGQCDTKITPSSMLSVFRDVESAEDGWQSLCDFALALTRDFNRINAIVQMDPNDFVLEESTAGNAGASSASGRRGSTKTPGGRKTGSKGLLTGTPSGRGTGTGNAGSDKSKKKRKRLTMKDSDEEDDGNDPSFDSEDDEYSRSSRKKRPTTGPASSPTKKKVSSLAASPAMSGGGRSGGRTRKDINYAMVDDELEQLM